MRSTRSAGAAVFALTMGGIATTAHAEVELEPITIAYEAPLGCPDRSAFFGEISARTARARASREGEAARVLHVAVAAERAGFTGRLVIEDGSHRSNPREVDGATCVEVVEALGLIAALAVDPKASTAPHGELAARSPEPSAASSAPRPPPTPAEPPVSRDAPPAGAPLESDAGPRFAAGVQVEGAALAGAVFSGRLFGEITLGDRTSLVAPSLRLTLARSLDVDRAPSVGGASLRFTQASIEGCPLRFALATTLALRPCAGITGGILEAEGTGVDDARSRARPWGTATLYGRLAWQPLSLLAIEAEVGPTVPFFRETFFFEPGVSIYEPPVIALLGRAGVAVHFP